MHYSFKFDVPTHPNDEFQFPQPRFKFMDGVVTINREAPEYWDVGEIVGMRLQFSRWNLSGTLTSQPYWEYNVKEPAESGNHIWLEEQYLVPEASVLQLQADWDSEPDVDDSLPEWADYYSNWQDYAIAEIAEAINPICAFDEF